MTRADCIRQFTILTIAIAVAGCGDDDPTSPPVELTLAEVVAQCAVGTLGDATTPHEHTGRVEASDCLPANTLGGRIEGWRLPQSSFGGLSELLIDVAADFDAVIVILGPDGEILGEADDDIGGDLGREQFVITKNLDPAMPQYFIGVFSYPGEQAGNYELTIGPVP